MRLLCRHILHHLLGHPFDSEKIQKLTHSSRLSFDHHEIKALLASLEFILKNSAKFGVTDNILLSELEQLGLPQDISLSIVKSYSQHSEELRKKQLESVLTLSCPSSIQWRVDYVLESNTAVNQPQPECHLQFVFSQQKNKQNQSQTFQLHLDKEKFIELYEELKAAKTAMKTLN
jgi:hypothetical protein